MSLIPKKYMQAVTPIGVRRENNNVDWIATGFFVIKSVSGSLTQLFLVTNKHVLEEVLNELKVNLIVYRLKNKKTGKLVDINLPLIGNVGQKLYSLHPDAHVDTATVGLCMDYTESKNFEFFYFSIDNDALCSDELLKDGEAEGSFAYTLGFPMKMVNKDYDMPICRGGCIARCNREEIDRTKMFIVDIITFPGNSGSPIITMPVSPLITDSKTRQTSKLIGIISQQITYTTKTYFIDSQTNEPFEKETKENTGLGYAVPWEYIRDVVDLEILRLQRSSNL